LEQSIVAQLVEQLAFWLCAYCPLPLKNKEDAVDQRYFACQALYKRWLNIALLSKN